MRICAVTETPAPPATLDDLARELNSVPPTSPALPPSIFTTCRATKKARSMPMSPSPACPRSRSAWPRRSCASCRTASVPATSSAELVGQWMDYALGESNNHAANQLLAFLGDGDITAGTRVFTDFMRSLGFESTYMQSGYDAQVQLPQIPTPGNQRTDWNTDPDSNLQIHAHGNGAHPCRRSTSVHQGEGLLDRALPWRDHARRMPGHTLLHDARRIPGTDLGGAAAPGGRVGRAQAWLCL